MNKYQNRIESWNKYDDILRKFFGIVYNKRIFEDKKFQKTALLANRKSKAENSYKGNSITTGDLATSNDGREKLFETIFF